MNLMSDRESVRSPWVLLGVPGLLAIGLYAHLFPTLIREWGQFPNLSHGFAIPFISAYLAWVRRQRLRAIPLEPSVWGLPVLVLGLGGLVVGVHGQESFIARISLPVTLLGLTIFLAGQKMTREVWAAIAYLAFMIPLPWATVKLMTYRSRLLDANLSALILGWLGVPISQEGVLLHLPNITLEVADECSSIPAIAALLAVGVAYASLARRPLAVRVALILATLPLAVTSNIIRIITVTAGVYYLGPWVLKTPYHLFNGSVNFLFTLVLLLLLDAALARSARGRSP